MWLEKGFLNKFVDRIPYQIFSAFGKLLEKSLDPSIVSVYNGSWLVPAALEAVFEDGDFVVHSVGDLLAEIIVLVHDFGVRQLHYGLQAEKVISATPELFALNCIFLLKLHEVPLC